MAAPVSAADAALVARVPAFLETLRCAEVCPLPLDEESLELALSELCDVFLAGEVDAPTHPAAVDELLAAGLISLLLARCATASPRRLSYYISALTRATAIRETACESVGLNGVCKLLDIVDGNADSAPLVLEVLRNTVHSVSVGQAICAEEGSATLCRLLALCDRVPSCVAFEMLGHTVVLTQAFFDCGIVTWLEKHLQRFVSLALDPLIANGLLFLCRLFLDTTDHQEAMQPLYHHFSTALSFFATLPSNDSDKFVQTAEDAAYCLQLCPDDDLTNALVLYQPGALASMARLIASRSPGLVAANLENLAHNLIGFFCSPPVFVEASFLLLLDVFFTLPALCSVPYAAEGTERLMAICTTPIALQIFMNPSAHLRVCAAAYLAHLADLDDGFVVRLSENSHVETLLNAVFEASIAPDDAALIMPGGCSRAWHTTALLIAVAHAARACRVAVPTDAEDVTGEEKRCKRPRTMGLDSSDVGVQHHDSTVFFIAARPFYVHSIALEKVSPILKQALEAAGNSREPIALPLAIDAPTDRHHALFGLAVEFAYTGAVSVYSY